MTGALRLRVKYTDPNMPKLGYIKGGDWIDLSTAEDVELKAGESKLISLGVCIEAPEGYESILAPRSSTHKKWGIESANSIGIIDNSYCGDNDVWHFAARATRDTFIPKYTRIAQFRIVENQPCLILHEVESLDNENRGGFGSTG